MSTQPANVPVCLSMTGKKSNTDLSAAAAAAPAAQVSEATDAPARVPISVKGLLKFMTFNIAAIAAVYGLSKLFSIPPVILYAVFGINWAVGIVSVALNSEKVFDLTGSLTYLATTLLSLSAVGGDAAAALRADPFAFFSSLRATGLVHAHAPLLRPLLASALTLVWAVRLGSFLFLRISHEGKVC